MSHEERLQLIKKIEKIRKSRVLVYITGDRVGLETRISPDIFPFIAQHLSSFKNPKKIDLFLYSTGGITMTGYSLVNMIREYTPFFGVLIPFKALSCATLIALGADEIIMTKMGQLSPIDPSFMHPMGPTIQIPGQPPQPVPISVEDIFNYLDLARTELKINEMDDLWRVLDKLSSSISPVILGHGYRLREQASFLADNILSTHLKDVEAKKKIVSTVTKGRFSHDYIFNRKEADEIIKLPIKKEPKVELLLEQLFKYYQSSLELKNPYNSEEALGSGTEANKIFYRAVIESSGLTHVFRTERTLTRRPIQVPGIPTPMPQVLEKVIKEGWVEDATF